MQPLTPGDPGWIGVYQVVARLGEQEASTVYFGRSARGRAVVIKALREDHPDADLLLRRLVTGVDDRSSVDDPAVPKLLKYDLKAESPWVASAFELGLTLAQAVAQFGPLPPDTCELLARELMRALRSIHAIGLSHGAVTPANVLLAWDGPRLLDLGTSLTPGAGQDPSAWAATVLIAAGGLDRLSDGLRDLVARCLAPSPPEPGEIEIDASAGLDWRLPAPLADATLKLAAAAVAMEARTTWRAPHPVFVDPMAMAPARPTPSTVSDPRAARLQGHADQNARQASTPPDAAPRRAISRRRVIGIGAGVAGAAALAAAGIKLSRRREPSPDTGVWRFDAGSSLIESMTVEPVAGIVCTVTWDDVLLAVDLDTGQERWRFGRGDHAGQWVAADQGRVLACVDGRFHVIDGDSGSSQWSLDGFTWGSVATDGQRAYIVDQQTITAVDLTTRQPLWDHSSEWSLSRGATVSDDMVLVGVGSEAACLDAATGEVRWTYDLDQYLGAAPVRSGELVWIGNRIGDLVALDAKTGVARHKLLTSDNNGQGDAPSRVAVAEQIAVVATMDYKVYAVDVASGTVRWIFETAPPDYDSGGIDSSPVIDNHVVYVGGGTEYFFAIDLRTGQERWRFRAGSYVQTSPAVYGDLVYFGSYDDCLYAVDKNTGPVH